MDGSDLITNPARRWFPGNIFHDTDASPVVAAHHLTLPPLLILLGIVACVVAIAMTTFMD